MDSIIRQVVREELRHSNSSRPETPSSTNQDDQGRSENKVRFRHEQWAVWGVSKTKTQRRRPKTPREVLPYKGLMGTCSQPGYVFRDFCLKQGNCFIIFCLNQGIDFINFSNRVSFLGR